MAIINQNTKLINPKLNKKDNPENIFNDIVQRIEQQSYSYSEQKNCKGKKLLNTSIFYEKNKDGFYYIPVFNWFDTEVSWIKINSLLPIELDSKYSYNKYPEITKTEMLKKFLNQEVENLVISKDTVTKADITDFNSHTIYIINEVLYKKRSYIVIHCKVNSKDKWIKIPIESSLSGRGNKILRNDEHGNEFLDSPVEEDKRYKVYKFNLSQNMTT